MHRSGVQVLLLLTLVACSLAAAEPSARDLVEKVYYRPDGDDMQSRLTMTLIDSRGGTRVRGIRQFRKDFGEVEKTIMFFEKPADVRNTSFMNWSYAEVGRDDDQWIYLPALKKVKRISSDSKGDYFMGSDFTYDDLGERHPDDDFHTLLGREEAGGDSCFVVESVPVEDDYFYSKTVSWIVPDKWIVVKKEFYDEDGDLLKTLSVDDYQLIDGYWIVTRTTMHNVQRDHTTIMSLEDVRLDQGIPDSQFSERMMMRGL